MGTLVCISLILPVVVNILHFTELVQENIDARFPVKSVLQMKVQCNPKKSNTGLSSLSAGIKILTPKLLNQQTNPREFLYHTLKRQLHPTCRMLM